MDALYWIKAEGPWMIFVFNRVNEMRRLSENLNASLFMEHRIQLTYHQEDIQLKHYSISNGMKDLHG